MKLIRFSFIIISISTAACLTMAQTPSPMEVGRAIVNGSGPTPVIPANSIPSTQPTLQVPGTTAPGLNTLPLPQNLTPNPSVAPVSTGPKSVLEGKYAEYQSYCRTNIYDVEHEYSQFLKSDTSLNAIKDLIDKRQFYDAEKLARSSRLKIGELNFLHSMILISALKRNFKESFGFIDSSGEEHKNDLGVKRLTSVVYELQGNYLEAKLLLQDLYKSTKNSDLLEGVCRLNAIDSQHRDAEISCEVAQRKLPQNFLPPMWLGISFRERQMYNEAKAEFEKSLSIRKSEFALTCLAEIENLKKDKKKSLENFLKVIEFNPQSSRGHTGLASLYFELRDYDKALEHFKAMCHLGVKDKIQFRRAQKELTLQKSSLAEKYFQEIQKCP